MQNSHSIRPATACLVGKILKPLTESNLITLNEHREIIAQLRSLANTGATVPLSIPRLLTTEETAAKLGIGVSNLKKLLKEERIPLKKKYIGTSVRFRSTEVERYILSDDDEE